MKTAIKKILVVALAASMAFSTTPNLSEVQAKTSKKTKLSSKSTTLTVGQTKKLTCKNISSKKAQKIKWQTSSKKTVALSIPKKNKKTVKLIGKSAGKAKITCHIGKKKYVCNVTVKKKSSTPKTITKTKIVYITVKDKTSETENKDTSNTTENNDTPKTPENNDTPQMPDSTETPSTGNVQFQSDVTYTMTKPDTWANLAKDPDTPMATAAEIEQANSAMLAASKTCMYNLKKISETYNGDQKKSNLVHAFDTEVMTDRIGSRTKIYLDNQTEITDFDAFAKPIRENIQNTATTEEDHTRYALCTHITDLKMAPVDAVVGWSADDSDDEFIDSSIGVNEPFVIQGETADGKWYYGMVDNCSGWVRADHMAVCSSREEWLSMWDIPGENTLVVTTGMITLASSNLQKSVSGLELTLGTRLPLVPDEKLPTSINERGLWYNYTVYVPTRDENGNLVKEMALISMNSNVHAGYLPFTKRNILRVAFSCLGDRYGWGGMLKAMDCSLYTLRIYRCFGFNIPRNTTWQKEIPSDNIDLSAMTTADKKGTIDTLVPGTLLMFKGHITMYIGSMNGKQYVISDLGSVSDTATVSEEIQIRSQYCVAITSLDVRRRSGQTWLENMEIAIRPWKF